MERTLRQWVMAALALAVPVSAARAAEPGLPSRLRVLVSSDEMPEMFSFDKTGRPGFERELVEGFCRLEGIALDPTYSAKAAAGLIDLVRQKRFRADDVVCFWHTGGMTWHRPGPLRTGSP